MFINNVLCFVLYLETIIKQSELPLRWNFGSIYL